MKQVVVRHVRLIMTAAFAAVLAALALFQPVVDAQGGRGAGSLADRFRQMSVQAETAGLAEPFKGITTSGQVQPGPLLRPLVGRLDIGCPSRGGGVPRCPVRAAAEPDDIRG